MTYSLAFTERAATDIINAFEWYEAQCFRLAAVPRPIARGAYAVTTPIITLDVSNAPRYYIR